MTNQTTFCPCGSKITYQDCCQIIHLDPSKAQSAEQLMRARYTAFVFQEIEFIYNTFHPTTRKFQNKNDIEAWSKESKWIQLQIIKTTEKTVEFEAHYLDPNLDLQIHSEKSNFELFQNSWYYVDGEIV